MAQESSDPLDEARVHLLKTLLRKVANDTYPSTTMLDKIEELLTPQDVPAYTQVLLAHIDGDTYPSIPMIDRVSNLEVG